MTQSRTDPATPAQVSERTSLLPNGTKDANTSAATFPNADSVQEAGLVSDDVEANLSDTEFEPSWKLVLNEFRVLLQGSLPVILAYTLQMSLQTISILIVGRGAPEDLAIAAFSYMFAMATAWLIALGGTTAMDTLCSAAFTGSKDPHELGIILQRAFFVLGLFYVPVVVVWCASEPLFLVLGQEPVVAKGSSQFLMCLIPGGIGYIYFECMKKFLQAQGIMRPGTYILLITSPLNAGLNYMFIYPFGFGLLGAPLATGISYWLSFLGLVAYARFVAGGSCFGGFSKRTFEKKPMLLFARLAGLGLFHVGTEWWAFEIITLVAGNLGTIPLAAQSVIATSDQIMNTIPFGIGVATSARVGNLLEARDAKGAARAANTAAWLSMFAGAVVLAILLATKDHFAKIFNDDEQVVKLTSQVMPWVALFQIADGLNGSCGGSLRGMGRQHIGAAANIISYYCGALPMGIALAYNGWGLSGLWFGNCVALYLTGFSQWIIVAWSNWEKQVRNAFSRMDHGAGDGTAENLSAGS